VLLPSTVATHQFQRCGLTNFASSLLVGVLPSALPPWVISSPITQDHQNSSIQSRPLPNCRLQSMDESSGQGSKSNRSTNTSRRSQPGYGGESSSRISLPSRGSQTPGRRPAPIDSPTSRSSSNPSPSSPSNDLMSRYAGQGPTTVSTTRPQQYQLVSPGTPADPRTMSQVSPGFIFVIFPMLRVACGFYFPSSFPCCPHLSPQSCPRYSPLCIWLPWRTQDRFGPVANGEHRTTRIN
jgi:hypothetical protein